KILLVGPEEQLRNELSHHLAARHLPIEIVNATEVIGMQEKAAHAVRNKRNSTMRVGLRLVKSGQAAGFVTAGNTGAAMATAKMVLGALPGVDRPALAAVFPNSAGRHPSWWMWAPMWIPSPTIWLSSPSWVRSTTAPSSA